MKVEFGLRISMVHIHTLNNTQAGRGFYLLLTSEACCSGLLFANLQQGVVSFSCLEWLLKMNANY